VKSPHLLRAFCFLRFECSGRRRLLLSQILGSSLFLHAAGFFRCLDGRRGWRCQPCTCAVLDDRDRQPTGRRLARHGLSSGCRVQRSLTHPGLGFGAVRVGEGNVPLRALAALHYGGVGRVRQRSQQHKRGEGSVHRCPSWVVDRVGLQTSQPWRRTLCALFTECVVPPPLRHDLRALHASSCFTLFFSL